MKLSELISGPGFYGEIVIMEPDETADDDHTYKEAYSRMDYRPLHAAEIPPRLLVTPSGRFPRGRDINFPTQSFSIALRISNNFLLHTACGARSRFKRLSRAPYIFPSAPLFSPTAAAMRPTAYENEKSLTAHENETPPEAREAPNSHERAGWYKFPSGTSFAQRREICRVTARKAE